MKDTLNSFDTSYPNLLNRRIIRLIQNSWTREDTKARITPIILWINKTQNIITNLFTSFFWGYDSPLADRHRHIITE